MWSDVRNYVLNNKLEPANQYSDIHLPGLYGPDSKQVALFH